MFRELLNLRELDLSHNYITTIPLGTFEGLLSLRRLDLSNNLLDTVQRVTFVELIAVEHVILSDNLIGEVSQDVFTDLTTLKVLNTDEYRFCCIAPQVDVCTPEPDEFSSCEDLMANYPLQISIWVLGVFAFIGNMFVVVWRINSDRGRVSSFFIINLGISDFLMGLYMLIIASVDVYYRGVYILYADAWRSSWLCQMAGILATLSSEVSNNNLTVPSFDALPGRCLIQMRTIFYK